MARPQQANVSQDLIALIERTDRAALKKYVEPWLPADLLIGERAALLRVSSRELTAVMFTYMPIEAQKKLLKVLTQEQAAALLNALPPDDRMAFLNELPLDVAMQMLARLTPDERQVGW